MAARTSIHDEWAGTATSALPSFLGEDPYPTRGPDGRPVSSSTAWTDTTSAASDLDPDGASVNSRPGSINPSVPGTTGPVGEPGLPPSRPTTGPAANSGGRVTASRTLAARGGEGLKDSDARAEETRPVSSTTHVPSISAAGFFRPMSSQQLQAQRGQSRGSALAQTVIRPSEDSARRHRYSNASLHTLKDQRPPTQDDDAPPVPTLSRGTDGSAIDMHQVAGSVASGNSTAPLNTPSGQAPSRIDTNATQRNSSARPLPPKSPKSFRESLRLSSRRASKNELDQRPSPHGHEKLHSSPNSPAADAEEKTAPFSPQHDSKPQPGKPARNYEYFAGNMVFFLTGRCMNTRARPLNLATLILTALPGALFFGFSSPWLWNHVSPAIAIIFAYIFYITISSFLHAEFSDPGILPRNLHPHPPNPEEERDPLTVGPPTTEWVMVKTFPSKSANNASKASQASTNGSTEEQRPGGLTAMEVPTKYCKSCAIWRPPRAHHCRVCDACIETQDHHCVWLNNCVGRRNYRFFFAYVGFASLMALLLLAFTLTHIGTYATAHNVSFGASLSGRSQERVAFAMFLYSVIALPYPGSLFVYHLFLIARGETTREYLNSHKFLPKDRHRPFSQNSWYRNWAAVLLRPRPPTYMQFRHRHEAGDLRFGHEMSKAERRERMKGRYSVSGPATEVGGEKHEMKQLSPRSQQSRRFEPRPPGSAGTGVLSANGSTGGLSGPINRTPR
ncbi:hypothetical protein EJ03DRAFT_304773 [Teratosphaeria nubilosa]|uniref:Palmitoyltransferase n=1 Tax=Teratosphaeria nubilosa TaxID=161662 RepID=A0A6G1LMC9_9PEZI|nr:hypothetical protein EJ03DRAFT_304773 [Teratosphaeria nubilosa]